MNQITNNTIQSSKSALTRHISLLMAVLATTASPLIMATEHAIQPRIYNGSNTTIKTWPWMAALIRNDRSDAFQGQFCGGTLIAKNWILTAAHCVLDNNNKTVDVNYFDVLLNRSTLSASGGERIAVEKILPLTTSTPSPNG